MKTVEFEGFLSGDGECFCFRVDTETFIRLAGQAAYDDEIRHRKEMADDLGDAYAEPSGMWLYYPSQLFVDTKKKLKMIISYEEIE